MGSCTRCSNKSERRSPCRCACVLLVYECLRSLTCKWLEMACWHNGSVCPLQLGKRHHSNQRTLRHRQCAHHQRLSLWSRCRRLHQHRRCRRRHAFRQLFVVPSVDAKSICAASQGMHASTNTLMPVCSRDRRSSNHCRPYNHDHDHDHNHNHAHTRDNRHDADVPRQLQ